MGIKASNVAFKSYKKTKTVSVKLFTTKNPYNGKTYLSAGKKVTLKVNGKTYTAQIDKYGNEVGYEKRLEDIKNRYGENSKPYLCSKQIIENKMNSESG